MSNQLNLKTNKNTSNNSIFDYCDTSKKEEYEAKRVATIDKTPQERKNFVKSIIMPIPQFTIAIDLLEKLSSQSGYEDPGGLRIYAESGNGKSCISDHFLKNHGPIFTEYENTLPVLFLRLKASIPQKELIKRLLRNLGYPFSPSCSAAELTDILVDALKLRGVKLILFDEAQEFGEGSGRERASLIGNTLKRLHDESNIPQAFLGTPKKLKRFFSIADQLGERITAEHELSPLAYDEYFFGVLSAFDNALPMKYQAGLVDNFSTQIFTSSNGNLRRIRRLLATAVFFSATDNVDAINSKYLSKSYHHVFGSKDNPFI